METVAKLTWAWLGRLPYTEAWNLQRRLVEARRAGICGDLLLLLEHNHVYTFGRRGRPEHLLLGEEGVRSIGAEVVWSDRGGDITYHGPGQLVGYPVSDLRRWDGDIPLFVRRLEATMVELAAVSGVSAGRIEGITGTWVGEDKLGAIGVKVAGGITSHGFAFNADTDLAYFGHIVACGLADKGVTSLRRLGVAQPPTPAHLAPLAARALASQLGLQTEEVGGDRIREIAALAPEPPPPPPAPRRAAELPTLLLPLS